MVEILGSVVALVSLAIQLTNVLQEYYKDVSNFKSDIEALTADSQSLTRVLTRLEQYIRTDLEKASRSLTTTSALWGNQQSLQRQITLSHHRTGSAIARISDSPNL